MNKIFTLALPAGLCLALTTGCPARPEAVPSAEPQTAPPAHQVVLSAANREHLHLQTTPVRRGQLKLTLKTVGRVSVNANRTARITSTLEGRLTQMNFDLGAKVSAGDIVAQVDSPELLGRPLPLKSPLDGIVLERPATVGEAVDRSRTIYTISDPTDLWVIAEVRERDVAAVKVGQPAAFTTLTYPGETFAGRVTLIGDQVESASRTVEVRIAVDNSDRRLKPGMFADIAIVTATREQVLLVPDQAVEADGDQAVVFVVTPDQAYERRVVTTGQAQDGQREIQAGLTAGEVVVTEGSFILKSELRKGELGEE